MLPITVDLEQVRVILVGDGNAARRRLDRLDGSGAASLEVYAPDPIPALVEAAGRRLRRRLPHALEVARAQLVFLADVSDPAAADILRAARGAGALVNVEDDPRRSDFHSPSVLRRGDLTVAISTSGKSPALAALMRRALESQLGPEWASHVEEIASLRQGWRQAEASAAAIRRWTTEWAGRHGWLAAGAHQEPPPLGRASMWSQRTSCFDQPVDASLSCIGSEITPLSIDRPAEINDNISLTLPDFDPGSVWLAGAGPGDPGLLSVLALHALGHADVVVYDALVDPRILPLARVGARLDYAGKRGGRPSPSQPAISERLIQLARAGHRVLRLKGGDPCVFGRGGEEALALAAADVPFRIVPGITAGIGGLAYAGIPVTHRTVNSAVTFITGHSGSADGHDWDAIARGAPVLVLYMASRHLPSITERLMSAGRRPDEPVAIISKATTPAQRVAVSTLAEVASATDAIEVPAIVVIGEVVRLRAALDWVGALDDRSRSREGAA